MGRLLGWYRELDRKGKILVWVVAVVVVIAALPTDDPPPEQAAQQSPSSTKVPGIDAEPKPEAKQAQPEPEPEPVEEPKAEDKPEPAGPPRYSIEDEYIDKGGGPGSAAALQVVAPDVERGEEAAKLAAVDYVEHDYVMMDLYASKAQLDSNDSYATMTIAYTERGSKWTGLDVGEMSYERSK